MVPLQLIPKARNFDINNLLKDHQAVEQVAHLMLADLAYTVDGAAIGGPGGTCSLSGGVHMMPALG